MSAIGSFITFNEYINKLFFPFISVFENMSGESFYLLSNRTDYNAGAEK